MQWCAPLLYNSSSARRISAPAQSGKSGSSKKGSRGPSAPTCPCNHPLKGGLTRRLVGHGPAKRRVQAV
eukprot:6928711-Pyramimonas_sp.AAC.1